jgi:hypothetical protein
MSSVAARVCSRCGYDLSGPSWDATLARYRTVTQDTLCANCFAGHELFRLPSLDVRIPYGSELGMAHLVSNRPCHDCDALPGDLHEPGCDAEECPTCRWQLLSCEHSPRWWPNWYAEQEEKPAPLAPLGREENKPSPSTVPILEVLRSVLDHPAFDQVRAAGGGTVAITTTREPWDTGEGAHQDTPPLTLDGALRYMRIHNEHRLLVGYALQHLAAQLITRAIDHDTSKFYEPEFIPYARQLPVFEQAEYGSEEYRACLRAIKPAIHHHVTTNSHHPEFFGAAGISGMTLVDLVEMLCDWVAAALGRGGEFRMDLNAERFGVEPQLADILRRTAEELEPVIRARLGAQEERLR